MHLFDKEVKPHPTWRLIVIAFFCITVGALSVSGLVYAMSKQVSIADDNGFSESFTTYEKTTAKILAEKGISLNDGDEVNFGLEDIVPDGAQIIVSRAVVIQVINGEEEYTKLTAKKTVADLLESIGISVGDGTILNVALNDSIFEGMSIKITHSKEELVKTEEAIPYKITKRPSTKLKEGETKVVQEGNEGLMQLVYSVYYENNKEISRELVDKVVVAQATDKVIEYGKSETPKTAIVYKSGTVVSRGGEIRYRGVIACNASAYCIKGKTASGMHTKVGAVAVDPKVIPLGSRLYIEAPDGSWSYGNAVAADTGGSIKGNKIDLYVETYQEAIKFGRRSAKVYILE